MDSKNLPPRTEAFFPTIFYKTQFCERQAGLPDGLDLSSKVAIITGSNAGLGFESAKQLLALNLSHLIMAVRSIEKGEKAATQLRKLYPQAKIEVWTLDMCSYASIQSFAQRVEKDLTRLDIALLNAGLVKPDFQIVKETGHEESMQVNYLSTVLLALVLIPSLRSKRAPNGQPGKLTMVNSGLSLTGKLPLNPKKPDQPILKSFDDEEKFSNTTWYNTSKTLMHLFLWKLSDYVSANDVVVNIVDPGYVKGTESVSKMPKVTAMMAKGFAAVTGRTVEVGASTYVDAVAVKCKESHCCFLTSWRVHPFAPILYTPEGKKEIERLWDETMAELAFAKPQEILSGQKD
ncbi:Short chain dehydrogenase yanD [Pseudocercospora fuligena]|uniref:Short chain dehydrogenase yanD n=1 Tax=Pseudocercospora fuligena TaxID=685502 RepID=A0A8H6VBS1_9PEZI|nr:Short chain dehydrogenase yanD [Pseudocercospora fuligena]